MTYRIVSGVALVLSVLLLVGRPADAQDVLVVGGNLIDGVTDDTRPNPGILISAGRILRIGDVPAGLDVTVLELDSSDYILPGLFDLHAHHAVDLFGQGRVDEREAYPSLFLANGVTSVFPAGEMNPLEMRDLRLAIDRGERPGPRILNSGPYFGSWRPGWDPALSADSLRHEIDYWVTQGVRSFKAKGISPIHLRVLIERAHQYGLTVTGHLGSGYRGSVNPRDAIWMGIDRVEHFLGGDALRADRPAYASLVEMDPASAAFDSIARLYITHGVYFDATLTAYGYYGRRDPEVYTYFVDERQFLTPYMRRLLASRPPRPVNEQFERIYWVKRRTVKAFRDAGGGHLLTLGTDHPSWGEFFSGFAAHRELLALVLSGLSPMEAIRVGTINGAHALGVSDRLGTLEPGKLADLFVVRGNPLVDIRHTRDVRWVMKGGAVFDAANLLDSVRDRIGPGGPEDESRWKPHPR